MIFRRSAATSRSASDLSENCAIEPITILRCFRLPSAPASRHLNSQTSGPRKRVDRVILPFCIASPFLPLVLAKQDFLGRTAIVSNRGELGTPTDRDLLAVMSVWLVRVRPEQTGTGQQFLRRESAGRFGGIPLCCGDVQMLSASGILQTGTSTKWPLPVSPRRCACFLKPHARETYLPRTLQGT